MVVFYILYFGLFKNGGYIESEESKIKIGYGLDIFLLCKVMMKKLICKFFMSYENFSW